MFWKIVFIEEKRLFCQTVDHRNEWTTLIFLTKRISSWFWFSITERAWEQM